MFYIEGKTHTIRVDEVGDGQGHINLVLFNGTFKEMSGAEMIGTIEVSDYDSDALLKILEAGKRTRELQK